MSLENKVQTLVEFSNFPVLDEGLVEKPQEAGLLECSVLLSGQGLFSVCHQDLKEPAQPENGSP